MLSITWTVWVPTAQKTKGEDGAVARKANIRGRDGWGGQKKSITEELACFSTHSIYSELGPHPPFPFADSPTCVCVCVCVCGGWRRGAGCYVISAQQPSLI